MPHAPAPDPAPHRPAPQHPAPRHPAPHAATPPSEIRAQLLWFADCPHHEAAESLLRATLDAHGIDTPIERIEVPDERTGRAVTFPGSPTIRINGRDIEPGWTPCTDCTPRCRLYPTPDGLRGLPPATWITDAIATAR